MWMRLYSLILPGTKEPIQPFPVAELISTVQSVTFFLTQLHYSLQLFTSTRPIINEIEIDFSSALMQSVCFAFNKLSIIDYVNCIHHDEKRANKFTVIHLCSSHMIKTTSRFMKKHLKKKNIVEKCDEIRKLALRIISALIHSDEMKNAGNYSKPFLRFLQYRKVPKKLLNLNKRCSAKIF